MRPAYARNAEHREGIAGDELARIAVGGLRAARASDTKEMLNRRKGGQLGKALGVVPQVFVQIGTRRGRTPCLDCTH